MCGVHHCTSIKRFGAFTKERGAVREIFVRLRGNVPTGGVRGVLPSYAEDFAPQYGERSMGLRETKQ